MIKRLKTEHRLALVLAVLLVIITGAGLLSFRLGYDFLTVNQYGDSIKMFGYGIYAHDSFFKAPIFIGSDATMLFIGVPLLIWSMLNDVKHATNKSKLILVSVVGIVLYYATSIAFGITYNLLCLVYIGLFSISLFTLIMLIRSLDLKTLRSNAQPIKGLRVFLIITGIALFAIWLMDIIPAWFSGESLVLIETYTTEITYVLDMGLISPMIFIALHLIKKQDGLGDVIIALTLSLCVIMGLMLPIQTIFQLMAGIVIPIPVLVIKVGVFMVLALFATHFSLKVLKQQ